MKKYGHEANDLARSMERALTPAEHIKRAMDERNKVRERKERYRFADPFSTGSRKSARHKVDWKRRALTAENALREVGGKPASGPTFYESRPWQVLRYQALKRYGRKCCLCGASNVRLHVDHIKPRSRYPELELRIDNLQVLCEPCNMGKGAWDESDWRKDTLKSIPGD